MGMSAEKLFVCSDSVRDSCESVGKCFDSILECIDSVYENYNMCVIPASMGVSAVTLCESNGPLC